MKRVVIVGGGTSGWMCAAALARTAQPETQVTLLESDQIGTIGVGEATIPLLAEFNAFLGIDEHDMLKECAGTFKLGIEFIDWYRKGHAYFHPFGFFGKDTPEFPFHQLWLKLNSLVRNGELPEELCGNICEYNLCTVAAKSGRFSQAQGGANTILSTMRNAWHFDSGAYGKLLRRYAEQRDVQRIEGKIVDVSVEPKSGDITSVRLENGLVVAGDLFIDCSGFRGLLINEHLQSEFNDWTHYLPCDRAIAIQTYENIHAPPYTRAYAKEAGWRWQIPLQSRFGNGYVYSGQFQEQQEALTSLLSDLHGEPVTGPNFLRFRTGHRRTFWKNNCIAIGLAGGFIEPLESTSIHLVQTGIQLLISLWSASGSNDELRSRYNKMMTDEYEDIRDFIILHYKATLRDDTAFWRFVRDMSVPDSLSEKMEQFARNGNIATRPDALFTSHSWLAVMLGQGIVPMHYDSRVDRIPGDILIKNMHGLREPLKEPQHRYPLISNILISIVLFIIPTVESECSNPGKMRLRMYLTMSDDRPLIIIASR